jgi:RNA polymerase sigma-70 factor, ECF subfamily
VPTAYASDEELLDGLRAGSETAFDQFVDIYRVKLFQYSYLMCGHYEDAEEVAQEALIKVFENFHQLRDAERLKGWVFRIARNACLMKRRKSVFAPTVELSLDELRPDHAHDGEVKLEIPDVGELPESALLKNELRQVIDKAIRELPEMYRSVMLLRDVEDLTTEETARVLDLTTDAVKSRLHRARLQIRKRLEQYLRHVEPAGMTA